MSFKKRTPIFGIPLHSHNEEISESDLKEIFTIIENQLYASSQGISSILMKEGDYSVVEDGGMYKVVLTPKCVSVLGTLNYCLLKSTKEIVWKNLLKGKFYYLYLTAFSDIARNPERFQTEAFLMQKDEVVDGYLLMATLDLSGELPVLDKEPDGKILGRRFRKHLCRGSNPHGEKLDQDNINVVKSFSIGGVKVWSEGETSLLDNKITHLMIDSGGVEGNLVQVLDAKKIENVLVSVQENYVDVGLIGVGYYGFDDKVVNQNEFVVYNNGVVDSKLRLTVFYR